VIAQQKTKWWLRGLVSGGIVVLVVAAGALILKSVLFKEAAGPTAHVHGTATPFFPDLFKVYVPRQVCMLYERPVIWLHLISDLLIGAAYYSIPLALVSLVRRRSDLAFHWVFWMFAAFILACGTTHFIGAIDLWKPAYKVDGIVKLITAILSVGTAVALWPLIPRAVALPSAAQLERIVAERTGELAELNAELQKENQARRLAEGDQARLAAIVESSQDAIIGKDLRGIVTSWNRAAEHLFGYSAQEMIGQPLLRIFQQERHAEETDILARVAAGQDVAPYESVRATRDGRPIDALITVSPIRERDGTIIGASTIVRDITLQKQSVRERERLLANERIARAEAENANRLKDDFLATVSHELRTPLTAIMGWSQLLRRNPSPEALQEGLQIIERNSRAQAKLIEDLLDLSRIITGKLRLETTNIRLGDVIHDALRAVEPAASAKEIQLQPVLDPNAPVISGDATRLQQVVWNLLTNAIKFTPKKGRVQVFLEQVNSQLEISVVDSGEGIAPEFLPHLFTRFSQADSSTTRRHGGLGIGLAIVRQLVELHGGRVEARSEGKDKGTTMIVRLPIRAVLGQRSSDATAATSSATRRQELVSLEHARILVVDDESDACEMMRHLLEPTGAKVDTATSAAQAFEIASAHQHDLLLLDIGMPEEDGYSLLRRIRRLRPGEGGDVPAIAVTAFARREDEHRAVLAGFQLYIAKPFEPAELLESVARVLRRS
jgi:PAS domain S-box-containing protein